ncbi:calcium-binding protein [uncultured Maritimibacter sp.]|uniref:calcium-binding protein n=1 Tax=uncultured Maritimibacter sp. TaxID=991866 RepID=UPI002591841C|nr:calcium-binding protein [uncultured Maritimibacter sp.]
MKLELTHQPATGLTVRPELFGGNTLYSLNSLDPDGSFVQAVDQLGVTGLRYPGGTMTEEWGAAFYDDPNTLPAHVTDAYSFIGLDAFLDWTTAQGRAATIVLPTSHLFVGDPVGQAPRRLDMAAVDEIGEFVADLVARHPEAAIDGFEIGNEYWGTVDRMTSQEYGILANAVAIAAQAGLDRVLGAGADQPAILVQSGQQWGRDFKLGGVYYGNGMDWPAKVTQANIDVLAEFTDAAKVAIDGLIEHYYFVETTDPLNIGDTAPEKADRYFREMQWDIRQWSAAFDPARHGVLDIAVTEWGVAWEAREQWGLKSAGVVLEMFEGLVRMGASSANVWPIELDGSVDFAGSHTDRDGADSDKLTARGQAFRLMAEYTIGLEVLDNGFSAADASVQSVEVNSYGSADRFVVFISSRDAATQDVELDVSAYVPGFSSMSGQRISLINDAAHWNEARWFAETDPLPAGDLGNSAVIDVTLKPFEVVMVEYVLNGAADRFAAPEYISGAMTADRIYGTDGSDEIWGRAGHDFINAGGGNDWVQGNKGRDKILTGTGDDFTKGRKGPDTILGGPGDDDLRGNRGHDQIFGEAGHDTLKGGRGNDWLYGGSGDDVIIAGRGDDVLVGGPGHDILSGKQGADRFVFKGAGSNVVTDYDAREDTLDLSETGARYSDLTIMNTTARIDGETTTGALIDYGEGTAFLVAIDARDLGADDFVF